MLELLKRLEWAGKKEVDFGHHDFSMVPVCPECGAENWAGYSDGLYEHLHEGHKNGCELKAAIDAQTAIADSVGSDPYVESWKDSDVLH